MKCDNEICIYQSDGQCKNDKEIEIDWHGLCKSMLPVRITRQSLELNKLYIKTAYEQDDEYYFDRETGKLTLKEEFLGRYDLDITR